MTQERLSVRKIREILRLQGAGLSNWAIARTCRISNSTVGEYLRRARAADLRWPLPERMSEDELFQKLFPSAVSKSGPVRPLPKWETVRDELKKKGVTLKLLWIEYRDEHPDGYGYTQFCDYYRKWAHA
jgi:transposase